MEYKKFEKIKSVPKYVPKSHNDDIDVLVRCLPLLREDNVILLNGILNDVGCGQHLLSILLGIRLDLTDLSPMGSPLHLSVVHLQEIRVSRLSRSLLPLLLPRIQASLSWVGNEVQWWFRVESLEPLGEDNRWEPSS